MTKNQKLEILMFAYEYNYFLYKKYCRKRDKGIHGQRYFKGHLKRFQKLLLEIEPTLKFVEL